MCWVSSSPWLRSGSTRYDAQPSPSLPAAVTSTRPPSTTHRPIVSSSTSSSSAPSATLSTSGAVSTGAVVGGIVGGFAALGLIGAAIFLFLRRTKEKKEKQERLFDASKFRRSAIMLDDPPEKRSKPQPPPLKEQPLRRYASSHASNPYLPESPGYVVGQPQHSSPSLYGPVFPWSTYGAQTPNAYATYGNHHGYPPQPQYHYGSHQYAAYPGSSTPSMHQPESLDNLVLPNPFPSPTMPITHHFSDTSSISTARDLPRAASHHDNLSWAKDADVPPAYEATGEFAEFKADVKPELTSSKVDDDSCGAAAPGIPDSTVQEVSATSLTSTPVARPSNRLFTYFKSLPSRPVSDATAYGADDTHRRM